MTTQQIHCFLEASKYLSFTEAARHLFITQSSLSKQIAALERELGVTLFNRGSRSVTLTAAGVLMRAECTKIETSLSVATSHAQRLAQSSEGHLSIGILDLLDPGRFITPALHQFQEKYPDVLVEIFCCGFRELRTRVAQKQIDMVFTKKFELENMPAVDFIEAYRVTPAVAVNSHNPLAKQDYVTMQECAEQQFIILDLDECPIHAQSLVDMCGWEGLFPRIVRYANSNAARLLYVHEDYGVALVDQEISVPAWADIRVIPMKSSLQDLFENTNVILTWRRDTANPMAERFASVVRDLAVEHMDRAPTTRMYYERS
ncbi:MAG: LysR family transcriptional regulator [Oscillospiraceae bacterium]|nr:LysR family transcriptional regulator [Oscillospiraceae bacterium]